MKEYNGSKTCDCGVFWPLSSYQTTTIAFEVRVIGYERTRLPIFWVVSQEWAESGDESKGVICITYWEIDKKEIKERRKRKRKTEEGKGGVKK